MLEDGLVILLTADAGVSALIATRMYPVQGVPDNPTYPYVTYQDIAGSNTEYTFSSESVDHSRIQFDIWSTRYSDGKAVTKAFANVLSGFVGTLTDANATRVLFAARLNDLDNFDNDSKSYRSITEYDFQVA